VDAGAFGGGVKTVVAYQDSGGGGDSQSNGRMICRNRHSAH
jgi:hypothetical protein